jgi:hypothetical protein
MYENVMRSIGAVLDNRSLYGPTHKVTVQSLEQAYDQLTQVLASEDALLFAITPDELHINNQLVDIHIPIIQHCVNRLREHELSTLTFNRNLSADEFVAFIDLVATDPEVMANKGGIAAKLHGDSRFTHIDIRKISYVEVAEDEVVVNKDQLSEKGGNKTRDAALMEYLGVYDDTDQKPTEDVTAGLREIMDTPAELGKVIMTSVGTSMDIELPDDNPLPPEMTKELVDRIVRCLERAFNALKDDRSTRTQKGKKALIKALQALEGELDTAVNDALSPLDETALAPIGAAIEEMTDELAIDALASEYLRKRKLIQNSEDRLLRYMSRHSESIEESELKNKLIEGGLTKRSWESLIVTSGVKSSEQIGSEIASEIPGFERLKTMLGQLSDCFRTIDPNNIKAREELEHLIAEVETQLEKLVAHARSQIEHLSGHLAENEGETEKEKTEEHRRHHKKTLEMIAEILQELCQPLSVVQCTIDVLLGEQIDTITDEQRHVIELAAKSANRLNVLIFELHDIIGNPSHLDPGNDAFTHYAGESLAARESHQKR